MASYGRKLREAQLAKYPTAPSLSKDPEEPMDWSDLYKSSMNGLKKLLELHRCAYDIVFGVWLGVP